LHEPTQRPYVEPPSDYRRLGDRWKLAALLLKGRVLASCPHTAGRVHGVCGYDLGRHVLAPKTLHVRGSSRCMPVDTERISRYCNADARKYVCDVIGMLHVACCMLHTSPGLTSPSYRRSCPATYSPVDLAAVTSELELNAPATPSSHNTCQCDLR
jgi:hypothetical protein